MLDGRTDIVDESSIRWTLPRLGLWSCEPSEAVGVAVGDILVLSRVGLDHSFHLDRKHSPPLKDELGLAIPLAHGSRIAPFGRVSDIFDYFQVFLMSLQVKRYVVKSLNSLYSSTFHARSFYSPSAAVGAVNMSQRTLYQDPCKSPDATSEKSTKGTPKAETSSRFETRCSKRCC